MARTIPALHSRKEIKNLKGRATRPHTLLSEENVATNGGKIEQFFIDDKS